MKNLYRIQRHCTACGRRMHKRLVIVKATGTGYSRLGYWACPMFWIRRDSVSQHSGKRIRTVKVGKRVWKL